MNFVKYFYNFSEVLDGFLEKCKLLQNISLLQKDKDLELLLLTCQKQDNKGYFFFVFSGLYLIKSRGKTEGNHNCDNLFNYKANLFEGNT